MIDLHTAVITTEKQSPLSAWADITNYHQILY